MQLHSVHNHLQVRITEGNRRRGGEGGELRILLDGPIEGILPHRSFSRNNLERIRNNQTILILVGYKVGEEGIEVDGLLVIGFCEMQFHSQNRFYLLDFFCRANHAAILQRRVTRRGESGSGWLPLGHVVAVDLHTVDIGNDSMGVAKTDLVGTDVSGTIENLAEVLRARRLNGGLPENQLLPLAVIEVKLSPSAREFVGKGPAVPLVDRGIQNEVGLSKRSRGFQNHVSVDAIQLNPRSTSPFVVIRTTHRQQVSVIIIRLEARLHNTRFVVKKLGRIEKIAF